MADNSDAATNLVLRLVTLIYKIILAYIEAILSLFKAPVRKSIRGQNVLITGSGHGLGRELALKFAKLGANLVLVDINETNNNQVKQELTKNPQNKSLKVYTYSVDIRDESQVAKLAQRVREDLGDVDILVNNAGIVQCLPFLELSPPLVERTFQVNVLSHYWTLKHFLPAMLENNRGHIVAISSIAGLIGSKYLTDYCASKFAVVGLMDSLDKEIHDGDSNRNIHFTTVCPSSMSTGMFKNFTTRFDWLLPVLKADNVASYTIHAILTNKPIVVIPPVALMFHRLSSIIPARVSFLVQDFLDYGVKPHNN